MVYKIFLKGNADECHLITSLKPPGEIEVSNVAVINEEEVKLLGIYIHLSFFISTTTISILRMKFLKKLSILYAYSEAE